MPVELPTNENGSLRRFTKAEYIAMDIRRRGVTGEGDHWVANYGPDGSGCARRFLCNWDQRLNAAIYFLGACTVYPSESVDMVISRLMPQRDPDYPQWIATKCTIKPHCFDGEIDYYEDEWVLNEDDEWELVDDVAPTKEPEASFKRADLEVTYELVPFLLADDSAIDPEINGETDRYVTWPGYPGADKSANANYIGLPGGILKYVTEDGTGTAAGREIPFAVGFVEGSGNFKIIWRRVPQDAWAPGSNLYARVIGTETVRGMVGSLNKTAFRGYPPLALQFMGVEERLLPDPTGIGYSWDLGYLFSHKPVPYGQLGFYFHDTATSSPASGYYQVLRPAKSQATGKQVVAAADLGDNDSLFPVREFKDLFQVGDVV